MAGDIELVLNDLKSYNFLIHVTPGFLRVLISGEERVCPPA